MSVAPAEFKFISDLVLSQSGIVLEAGKEYLVEARLNGVVRSEGLGTLPELIDRLRASPHGPLQQRVVFAMTTNETSFFRDIHPFEAIKSTVLPEFIRTRAATREINIWCAAASTGQEPYSLAMLIVDNFPQLQDWKVRILATDLSLDILAKAKAGRFSQLDVNRGLPATSLVKHFRQEGPEWVISDRIKNMIQFEQLNLTRPWKLPMFDMVLIRNVLIYFNLQTKKDILGRIRNVMRNDGYLFLGGAESTLNIDSRFERVQIGKAGCYRHGPG